MKLVPHVVMLTTGSGRMELNITGPTGTKPSQVISTMKSVQDFMGMGSGMMTYVPGHVSSFARKSLPVSLLHKVNECLILQLM